jgi:hypothetical protein
VAAVAVFRKEEAVMMLVSRVVLVLALAAGVAAQTNWSDLTTDSAQQAAPGLKIVKVRARPQAMQGADNTRAFTIVIENTGERAIKSIDFMFEVADENRALAADANGNQLSCGFIIAELDVKPGDVVTIERELSGNHCIPPAFTKQVVQVEQILYSDGSAWRRPGYEDSGWIRVKTSKAGATNPQDR